VTYPHEDYLNSGLEMTKLHSIKIRVERTKKGYWKAYTKDHKFECKRKDYNDAVSGVIIKIQKKKKFKHAIQENGICYGYPITTAYFFN